MAKGDNYFDCDNWVDNLTLIKSLIDRDANGDNRIRVTTVTASTESEKTNTSAKKPTGNNIDIYA